jgi:hypothetical protein
MPALESSSRAESQYRDFTPMQQLHSLQVLRPGLLHARRQHRHPVFETFPSRTTTWFCPKSTSLTRSRTHSINLNFETHDLADLVQKLELGVGDEPLTGP